MSIGHPDYGGTPLIKTPALLISQDNPTIVPGTPKTYSNLTAVGTSYAIVLFIGQLAVGTVPFVTVDINIGDKFNNRLDNATFDLPLATTQFGAIYLIRGPLLGNSLSVVITSQDSVNVGATVSISTSNIERPFHAVTTVRLTAMMAGFNLPPNLSPLKGILGTWYQAAVPSGNVVPFIVPPAPGPVSIGIRADSGTTDVTVTAAPYISENGYGGLANGNLLTGRTDASGNFMTTINFPRTAMAFNLRNTGAAAQGISTTIIYDVTSG